MTIFRTSQVFKDVGMFVSGEMFADASGEVSVGVTNITGTMLHWYLTLCCYEALIILNTVKGALADQLLQILLTFRVSALFGFKPDFILTIDTSKLIEE